MKNRVLKFGLGGGLAAIFGGMVWGGLDDTQVCQATAKPGEYVVYNHRSGKTLVTMTAVPQQGEKNPMGPAIVSRGFARASFADILSVEPGNGYCALHLNDAAFRTRETRIFPLLSGIKGP